MHRSGLCSRRFSNSLCWHLPMRLTSKPSGRSSSKTCNPCRRRRRVMTTTMSTKKKTRAQQQRRRLRASVLERTMASTRRSMEQIMVNLAPIGTKKIVTRGGVHMDLASGAACHGASSMRDRVLTPCRLLSHRAASCSTHSPLARMTPTPRTTTTTALTPVPMTKRSTLFSTLCSASMPLSWAFRSPYSARTCSRFLRVDSKRILSI
mmetsp:Transcript_2531/g.5587  ORF Transcript_2531/g.5587 Transcript_2531/m.5587 type:complete len:207 (+) Transcript_2531:1206-1826(+)